MNCKHCGAIYLEHDMGYACSCAQDIAFKDATADLAEAAGHFWDCQHIINNLADEYPELEFILDMAADLLAVEKKYKRYMERACKEA